MKQAKTVVVSIGVSEYAGSRQLEDIPCAHRDAHNLHKSLRLGLGEAYDMWRSVTMLDPSANEALAVLTSTSRGLRDEDLLVVYFSGHARLRRSVLSLAFSDALDDGRGHLSVSELAHSCAEVRASLILDCCHSGAAASMANRPDILSPTAISVLASSAAFSTAVHLPEGSPFTTDLIKVIEDASVTGAELSLVTLAKELNSSKGTLEKCVVNIAEGNEDVVLLQEQRDTVGARETADRFVNRLASVDRAARELMWHSAAELPQAYQSVLVGEVFSAGIAGEASWLTRRAVGSFLERQPGHSRIRKEVVNDLINSENWMEVCVGLIGARHLFATDADLRTAALNVLASRVPANATWLASMYLTDCSEFDFDSTERSQLAQTSWGITEILEHFRAAGKDREWLSHWALDLATATRDDNVLAEVATHLRLNGLFVPAGTDVAQVAEEPLSTYLYSLAPRGKLASSSGKWLLSSLFGNWRRDGRSNLRTYAASRRPSAVLKSLERMGALPAVALRTAVLSDPWTAEHPDRVETVLSWGLVDEYPWVRQAAVELAADGRIGPITEQLIDMARRPGLFDLLLTLKDRDGGAGSLLELLELTPVERAALARDGC
ncbi:caspase family protein [Streptomyces europaeiscabiei]|uniref:caspase family protein n=1 Tax=Streptomyces europaeiscabiei TaxID=146819 RepID=UPI002E19AC41